MKFRCERCRATFGKNSAFAVLITVTEDGVDGDIVRANSLQDGDIAVHVNGDLQCLRKVSGYRGTIIEKLRCSEDLDVDFLDTL
jgi:hypothetical protein